MAPTVVIIEDEATIAEAVAARLASEGFDVEIAGDGITGVELCHKTKPDLVVLDLMLPGIDGLEVCRRIQADRRVPVVMLTARDGETDMLVGLAVGADDYVTKPFSPRELVARIRAVLRRTEGALQSAANGQREPEPLRVGDLAVDVDRRRVHWAGAEVQLTATEFDLLAHMASRAGTVFTRERLLAEVWGYADSSGARTVDSHVRALRRKIAPSVIRTVHGVGYAVDPQ